MRPSIHESFIDICDVIARRSTCLKNKVGCVIVRDGRIISQGVNGRLSKLPNCCDTRICDRKNIPSGTMYEIGLCNHAEQNAIFYAAKYGISTNDTTIYVNSSICRMCMKSILAAGITNIYYRNVGVYGGEEVLQYAKEYGGIPYTNINIIPMCLNKKGDENGEQ